MAGKVLKYKLEYREKGESHTDTLAVSFVSNWCVREFNQLSETLYEVTSNWNRYNNIKTLMSAEISGGDTGKSIEEYESELEVLVNDTLKVGDVDFAERRFELIKVILEDNNIKTEKYYDFNFWDRQVEPAVQNGFIEQCVFKDIPTDKKKMM